MLDRGSITEYGHLISCEFRIQSQIWPTIQMLLQMANAYFHKRRAPPLSLPREFNSTTLRPVHSVYTNSGFSLSVKSSHLILRQSLYLFTTMSLDLLLIFQLHVPWLRPDISLFLVLPHAIQVNEQ